MSTKLRLAVALAALLALPGLALAQQTKAAPAPAGGAIEVTVTGDGFVPARIAVKKGQKVKLVVTRKTERTCATEIVIKEAGIDQKLPLNQPVTVEFTPQKAGTLKYTCGMDMISGVFVVE